MKSVNRKDREKSLFSLTSIYHRFWIVCINEVKQIFLFERENTNLAKPQKILYNLPMYQYDYSPTRLNLSATCGGKWLN